MAIQSYDAQPLRRYSDVGRKGENNPVFAIYGHLVPTNIYWAEIGYDVLNGWNVIKWIAANGSKHEMPCHPDNIEAVLVAMKLSE